MLSLFFFNDTATTEIYTLSLHDALPISEAVGGGADGALVVHRGLEPQRPQDRGSALAGDRGVERQRVREDQGDRKSTRLNSSHANISYAVFCLKKKKEL